MWIARPVAPDSPVPAPEEPGAPAPLIVGHNRTVTLLSLGGADTDELLTRVRADIGGATEAVENFWGTDWASTEIVVVATGSAAQFAAAAPGAPPDMAAVAVADVVRPDRGEVSGQRIVLAPGAARMSADALRIVLTHELFHYASRAGTALDAPRWLTEGVADYVARQGEPIVDRSPPDRFPDDSDFDTAGAELSAAYDRAWSFARYVAERHGSPALRALYVTAAGPDRVDFNTALHTLLHAEPDAVLADWRHWLANG